MTIACVRELVRTRETGHDIDIHIEICIFYMTHPHPLPTADVPATPQKSPAVTSID